MIEIPKNLFEKLISYCREQLPNEACGALFGTVEADFITIGSMMQISNIAQNPKTQFAFDPHQLVPLLYSPKENKPWVGIFHSHPTASAQPSVRDLETYWSVSTYWIISFEPSHHPSVKAYKIITDPQKKPVSLAEQAITITENDSLIMA